MKRITDFTTKEEFFQYLKENKNLLIAEKKASLKQADAIGYIVRHCDDKGDAVKSLPNTTELLQKDKITVEAVINTTGLMDSHDDVHLPGLWHKTLHETKNLYLLQEHVMKFDHVISDKVKAKASTMTWKELGVGYEGETQALVFTSEISKSRNQFMFEQYASGHVTNHSVGMRYVKIFMCVNSDKDYWEDEKKSWDKYIDKVVNREEAEEQGYFYAVTEAKLIEGSAVLMGSNWVTPTQSVKEIEVKEIEPEPPIDGTQDKIEPPLDGTQKSVFEKLSNLKIN